MQPPGGNGWIVIKRAPSRALLLKGVVLLQAVNSVQSDPYIIEYQTVHYHGINGNIFLVNATLCWLLVTRFRIT